MPSFKRFDFNQKCQQLISIQIPHGLFHGIGVFEDAKGNIVGIAVAHGGQTVGINVVDLLYTDLDRRALDLLQKPLTALTSISFGMLFHGPFTPLPRFL